MAAPTTPILTTFPEADQDPLSEGGAWTATPLRAPDPGNLGRCQLLSNQAARGPGVGTSESVWASSFAADQEAYATLSTVPPAGSFVEMCVRVIGEGADSVTFYLLAWNGTFGFQFFRKDSGASSFVQLGASVAFTLNDGDSTWLKITGSTLEGFYRIGAGAWVSVGTRTDTTYTTSGKIAMAISADTTRVDNFGGGSTAVGNFAPVIYGRGAC